MNINPMIRGCARVAVLISGLLVMNCTHHFVPNTLDVNQSNIIDFQAQNEVQLLNAQDKTEPVKIYRQGIHGYEGNLHEWTNKAIDLLKTELGKKDMMVTETADKKLKLAITDARNSMGFMVYIFDLTLQAETGEGLVKKYSVTNSTPGSLKRAAGGAITLAVTELLNDPEIVEYLRK